MYSYSKFEHHYTKSYFKYVEPISEDYRVFVNGEEIPVYTCRISKYPFNTVWPGHQRPFEQSEAASFVNIVSDEEIKLIADYSFKVNRILSDYLKEVNIELIDFKLEFGKTSDGTIVLADEISPDTCRFWDSQSGEKLDKDRFRRDLGNVEDAYREILKRLLGE